MFEKTYSAEYYQKNRDRILASQRAYHHRTENAERIITTVLRLWPPVGYSLQ